MKKLIQFPGEDGEFIVVEVEEAEPLYGEERVATLPGEVVETASQTFEAAMEKIRPALSSIVTLLRDINEPNEIAVEFGIKMSAKAGAFVASADAEANFSVKLTWQKKAD